MTSTESYFSLLAITSPASPSQHQENNSSDIVLQATYLGSQAAYDAIVHAFVTSKRKLENGTKFTTHPAVLMMAASDKDSYFANRQVFHEALRVLLRFDNSQVSAIFNRQNSFIYEYACEIADFFPRLIYDHKINKDLQNLGWDNPNTTINQMIFMLTWNFLNSPIYLKPERKGTPYKQWFEPRIIGYPFRLLRRNTTKGERPKKLKFSMSRHLLDQAYGGSIAYHESELAQLRNCEEKIESQIFLPLKIIRKLSHIMFEASEQCFAFDWKQTGSFDRESNWRIHTPMELMEFEKDSELLLTKAGKHLCGFGIAVGLACEDLINVLDIDSADFNTALDVIDIKGVDTGEVWESFMDCLDTISVCSRNLEEKFPDLAPYKDYYLNHGFFGQEPFLHLKIK